MLDHLWQNFKDLGIAYQAKFNSHMKQNIQNLKLTFYFRCLNGYCNSIIDNLQYSKTQINRRVPPFTGSLDLPGLNSIPQKQALCVNQCMIYPDIPCFSTHQAFILSPKRPGKWVFYCILLVAEVWLVLSIPSYTLPARFPSGLDCSLLQTCGLTG